MTKTLGLSSLCIGLAISSSCFAAEATGTLTVQATIVSSCAVNTSATGTISEAKINFGDSISSFSSNVDVDTASTSGSGVTVLCNNGTIWSLASDSGLNASSTQRRMSGGSSEYIPYDLYSDSNYSNIVTSGIEIAGGTGTGSTQDVVIYGRIPSGTALPTAGTYTDTVTLTVTY